MSEIDNFDFSNSKAILKNECSCELRRGKFKVIGCFGVRMDQNT
jgi:hypothetical protein